MTLEMAILVLILAVVALFIGAELSLSAAEKVGKLFGIPPLVIGLLIIGLGTSLPEFFVSHLAAMNGQGQMAIGNIVGSNISNLLLVLGVSIIIQKIAVDQKATFHQVGIHLLLSLILSTVLLFDQLSAPVCLVLIAFFLGHLTYTYLEMKKSQQPSPSQGVPGERAEALQKGRLFAKLFIGFTLLYAGGEGLVQSGSELCRLLGISEYAISVIFIALGTSLPELVTSLLAVVRKKDLDLIVGNIIGSNIFNVAFVMASLICYRIDLSRVFFAEIIVLLSSSLLLFVFAYRRWALNRFLGVLLLGMYSAIIFYWTT